MESFTKTEIAWIASEMNQLSEKLDKDSSETPDRALAKMLNMRSCQYADISKRLRKALKNGSRRIGIK